MLVFAGKTLNVYGYISVPHPPCPCNNFWSLLRPPFLSLPAVNKNVTHSYAFAAPAASSAPCLWRVPVTLPPPRRRTWRAGTLLQPSERGMIGAGAWSRSTSSVTRRDAQRRRQGSARPPVPE